METTEIMEDKKIRRNLYRVLRKTGVKKKDINLNATYSDDLKFDTVDWTIFTFYLEGIFNISINEKEIFSLENVKDTLHYLGKTA
jgi:acyl carrier protein